MTYIIFGSYFLLINIVSYVLMVIDARRARKGRRRIPESSLMSAAIFFGAPGIIAGMRKFGLMRGNPKFTVGIPIIFSAELIAAAFMLLM